MVDTSVVNNLSSKLQDLKSNYKSDSKSNDNKDEFKKYLSKEVKSNNSESKINDSKNANNTTENSIKSLDSEENKVSNKELASEISEKLEKLLNNEDLNVDSLDENLEKVISLLLNLINIKDVQANNSENIVDSESDILAGLTNVNFQGNSDKKLSNEDINIILNLSEDNTLSDTKETLNNINNLLVEYLDNINTKKVSTESSFNNIKSDLLKEVKNLVNILPEKVVNEVKNNLDNDISKEIFNELLLGTNKDSTLIKEDIKSNDINENILISNDTKTNEKEADVNISDDLNQDNINDSKTIKEKSVNKEEKVLMKILDDESSQSFSKTLNYYDKLNKTNSIIEVVKEPVVINKDNVNLDFIKNIRYMVKNSVEELKVKIYPKELGEITIKLLSEEGIMKAEIKATSKETYNLLNSNLNEIKKTLENQNIRIQEVNIGIYNEDTTFFSGRENSKETLENQRIDRTNNIPFEEQEIAEDLLNNGNVNLLA